MKLKGITVRLYERTQTGVDALNRPTYEETVTEISNVLVGQPTSEEILETLNLTGRKATYTLGIPKGDTHDWENKTVEFWNNKWKTIGVQLRGIESLIPMEWGSQIMVERYE